MIALARADDHEHPEEIERIVAFAARRAEKTGLIWRDSCTIAFTRWLNHLHPSRASIERTMEEMRANRTHAEVQDFARCFCEIAKADGLIDPRERQLLEQIVVEAGI